MLGAAVLKGAQKSMFGAAVLKSLQCCVPELFFSETGTYVSKHVLQTTWSVFLALKKQLSSVLDDHLQSEKEAVEI